MPHDVRCRSHIRPGESNVNTSAQSKRPCRKGAERFPHTATAAKATPQAKLAAKATFNK